MGYVRNWEIDSLFVTAMLTVIGFSVHDTIIIFDRIPGELAQPDERNELHEVVNVSVNQTLSRSINTSFTVIITLLALFFFGGPVLKLFIAALLFGIISGTTRRSSTPARCSGCGNAILLTASSVPGGALTVVRR